MRYADVRNPTPIFLLQVVPGLSTTSSLNPTESLSGASCIDSFNSSFRETEHAWILFPQPFLNPYIWIDGLFFTTRSNKTDYKIYVMTKDLSGVPWNPETITWNSEPSLPTDSSLITEFSLSATGSSSDGQTIEFTASPTLDLRNSGLVVYGLSIQCVHEEGSSGSGGISYGSAVFNQAFVLSTDTERINVVSCSKNDDDNPGVCTITLDKPHHITISEDGIDGETAIRVRGVGNKYDSLDVYGNLAETNAFGKSALELVYQGPLPPNDGQDNGGPCSGYIEMIRTGL